MPLRAGKMKNAFTQQPLFINGREINYSGDLYRLMHGQLSFSV
jgi:hypothetical protein